MQYTGDNYGVINIGTIHGNVVSTINQGLKDATNPTIQEIHHELIKLADAIEENQEQVSLPIQALDAVGRISEELNQERPMKSALHTFTSILKTSFENLPKLLDSTIRLKQLIDMFVT